MTELHAAADDAGLVDRLRRDYADLSAEAVLRQIIDAQDAVALFGVEQSGRGELVERLVRSHLDGLSAARPSAP